MLLLLLIMAWGLMSLCIVALILWIALAVRLQIILSSDPSVRKGVDLPPPAGGWPRLSVIIPAHNEEEMIEQCTESLRRQNYPNVEFIFVLDRCTDDTARRLSKIVEGDDRFIVIENETCPDDWAGKCNAVRIGVERADGDWLLCTDADTIFDPDLCRAAVAMAVHEDLALLSLLATLTSDQRFEQIVQPVASMALMQMYPPGHLGRSGPSRPFANGQFMLFRRDLYDRVGGHASVKDDLLEDIAISRVIAGAGGRVGVLFADGMLTCDMYHSFEAFKEGWNRIYIEACKRRIDRLRKNSWKAFAVGVILPAAQVAELGVAAFIWRTDLQLASFIGLIVLVAWGLQLGTLIRIYRLCGAPSWAVFGYPLGSFVVGRIMRQAARDLARSKPILWGGREYVLKARTKWWRLDR